MVIQQPGWTLPCGLTWYDALLLPRCLLDYIIHTASSQGKSLCDWWSLSSPSKKESLIRLIAPSLTLSSAFSPKHATYSAVAAGFDFFLCFFLCSDLSLRLSPLSFLRFFYSRHQQAFSANDPSQLSVARATDLRTLAEGTAEGLRRRAMSWPFLLSKCQGRRHACGMDHASGGLQLTCSTHRDVLLPLSSYMMQHAHVPHGETFLTAVRHAHICMHGALIEHMHHWSGSACSKPHVSLGRRGSPANQLTFSAVAGEAAAAGARAATEEGSGEGGAGD